MSAFPYRLLPWMQDEKANNCYSTGYRCGRGVHAGHLSTERWSSALGLPFAADSPLVAYSRRSCLATGGRVCILLIPHCKRLLLVRDSHHKAPLHRESLDGGARAAICPLSTTGSLQSRVVVPDNPRLGTILISNLIDNAAVSAPAGPRSPRAARQTRGGLCRSRTPISPGCPSDMTRVR